jgi:hypothetical protein
MTSRHRFVIAAVALSTTLVGCADDPEEEASPDPAATRTALCDDWEAFRASLDELVEADISEVGAAGLLVAVDDVLARVDVVRASATDRLRPEIHSVDEAVDTWRTLAKDPNLANTAEALTRLGEVVSAADVALEECPS